MDLEMIRQEIDQLDREIVSLLEKRMELVTQVAAYKKETGKPILDNSREQAVLHKVEALVENPEFTTSIRETFKDMMTHSRAFQKEKLDQTND